MEIYFSGFGWLPFDPTPGTNDAGGTLRLRRSGGRFAHAVPLADGHTDAFPFACAGRIAQPHAIPFARTGQHAPRPSRTRLPIPRPQTPPPSDNEPPRDPPHMALAAAASAAPLRCLAALRLYLCAPAQVAGRQKNANDALLVWYRAAEDALLCMGIAPLPGEAPASFLWRAQGELHDAVKLTGLGKALCVAQYSGRTLKRTQPERAQKVYAALFAQMTLRQELCPALRAALHPWDSAVRCLQFRQ